jgi:hypothetical protein
MLLCGAEERSSVTPVTTLDTLTHRLERLARTLAGNPEFQPNPAFKRGCGSFRLAVYGEPEIAVLRRRKRNHNG